MVQTPRPAIRRGQPLANMKPASLSLALYLVALVALAASANAATIARRGRSILIGYRVASPVPRPPPPLAPRPRASR